MTTEPKIFDVTLSEWIDYWTEGKEAQWQQDFHFSAGNPVVSTLEMCAAARAMKGLKELLASQAAEITRLTDRYQTLIQDECDDDTAIREIAKRVLPESVVDGDSHYVPGMVDLVELMAAEITRLRAERDDFARTLRRCSVAAANLSELPDDEAVQAAGKAAFHTDLTTVCDIVNDRIATLECEAAQAQAEVERLTADNAALRAEIDRLKDENATLIRNWCPDRLQDPPATSNERTAE